MPEMNIRELAEYCNQKLPAQYKRVSARDLKALVKRGILHDEPFYVYDFDKVLKWVKTAAAEKERQRYLKQRRPRE